MGFVEVTPGIVLLLLVFSRIGMDLAPFWLIVRESHWEFSTNVQAEFESACLAIRLLVPWCSHARLSI
jgi:hypothetical protein